MKRDYREVIFWILCVIILVPTVCFSLWYHYTTSVMVWEHADKSEREAKIEGEIEKVKVLSEEMKSIRESFITSKIYIYQGIQEINLPDYSSMITYSDGTKITTSVSPEYHNAMITEHNSKLELLLTSLIVLKGKVEIITTDIESLDSSINQMLGVVK